jgi:20S proteasome alpha/beta subunit
MKEWRIIHLTKVLSQVSNPLCSKPRVKPEWPTERRSMTLAIGFHCHDGLVLCADSLESDGYTVRQISKVRTYTVPDAWAMGIACAGDGGPSDNFVDKLKVLDHAPYDRRKLQATVEAVIKITQESYKDSAFRVMIGLCEFKGSESMLFRNDGDCLAPVVGYAAIGLGSAFAEFFLRNIHEQSMGIDEAARLGALVVRLAESYVDGVRRPTSICSYRHGDTGWHLWDYSEVQRAERRCPDGEITALMRDYWRSRNSDVRRIGDFPLSRALEGTKAKDGGL